MNAKWSRRAAVIALVVAASGCSRCGGARWWPGDTFTAEAWKASPKESRYVFYKDLESRHLLVKLTRPEVIDLLGPPDSEPSGGRYITYVVKNAEPGEYTLNAVYLLHIEFDDTGRVARTFVRAD